MTQRELKRLSRGELLELLLIQTKENERLQEQLSRLEAQLTQRNLKMEKAGDLAHAVLELNGVVEATQAAAQQYLDNIVAMEQDTKEKCRALLEEAEKKAQEIQRGQCSVRTDTE